METATGLWCYQSLYSDKLDEKTSFNIPDSILFENGLLDKWVFSNRQGQVVRKRPGNETQMSVKEKFAKIASASMTNYQGRACVLRHRDGSFSILDGQSFLEFAEVWPPSDPNILAVQAYVQGRGNQGTIFRSKYSVVNSSGRVSLQHSSFLSMPPGSEEEATVKIGKENLVMTASKSASTNETLNSLMRSAVSQVERVRRCKVISMTADFLIDYQDQIWLVWMDDVKYLSGENAKDLSKVGIRTEPDMRGSWLNGNPHGPFPSAAEQRETAKLGHKSPKTSPIRARPRRMSKTTAKVSNELMGAMAARVETDGETRRQGMKLAMDRTIFVDPKDPQKTLRPTSPFKTPGVGAGRPVGLQLLGGEGPKEEAMGAEIGTAKPDRSQFPSNIKCNGQFCNLRIRDASELRNARGDGGKILEGHEALSKQYASVRKLKKGDMNDILGKAKKMSTTEYYSVPYASIYRAKTESQLAEASYRKNNAEIETAWQAYPTTPREHRKKFNLDDEYWKLAHGDAEDPRSHEHIDGAPDWSNTSNDVRKHTVASKIKSEWGEKVGEVQVPGGTHNFYRRVNVCGECCRAYMLLDKAREILHKDKDEEEGKKKFAARTDGIPDDPHTVHAAWTRREEGKAEANARMRKAAGGGQLANDVFHQQDSYEGGPSIQFDDSAVLGSSTITPPADGVGVEYLFFPSPKKGMTFEEHQQTQQQKQEEANGLRPMTSPLPKKPKRKRQPESFRPMTSPDGRNRQGGGRLAQNSIGNDSEVAFNEHYRKPLPRRRTTTVPAQPGSPPKATWKARRAARQQIEQEYEARGETAPLPEAFGGKFDKLDKFLRGEGGDELGNKNLRRANELMSDTASASYVENFKASADFDMYRAKVLVAINDMGEAEPIAQCLEDQGYIVAFENDGITVMDILHSGNYDCLVVQNDLFVKSAKEITSVVRDRERTERKKATRKMAMDARNRNQSNILNPHTGDAARPKASHPSQVKSLPILVYTEKVAPDDLKSYMEAGMDGCLSRPFDADALLTTLRQAVPKHMKPREEAREQDKAVRYKNKNFTLNSRPTNDSSSDLIAKTLALSASFANNEGSVSGVLQFDADTVFPYTVMDSSIDAAGQAGRTAGKQKAPFFNLVVCHDLFDTSERMKIFLRPISKRYPGLQILLWNYPGQAFTTFREEQLLNNEFHAQCLNSLFDHVGPSGTGQFDTDKPFYILGYGNGGNIASFYSAFYSDHMKSLRALILINSFSYVDPHMASVLHDCMNVFSCSPPNRPDLPIYFFSRFLFSPTYLSSVSTPLALNLYTAVHNPITLAGRIQLCLGALSHIDMRNNLKEIPVPIINVQGTQDALVRPMHTDMWISKRDGETKSIHRCLQAHANNPKARRTCQIWVNSGHEVFQEKRNQVLQLVEQMVIGYHENADVSFMPAMSVDREAAIEMDGDLKRSMKLDVGGRKPLGEKSLNGSVEPEKFEDHFVGNLTAKLGGLNKKREAMVKKYEEDEDEGLSFEERVEKENTRWNSFAVNVSTANQPGGSQEQGGKVGKRISKYSSKSGLNGNSIVGGNSVVQIVTDPTKASFEKNNRVIHGHKKADDFGLYANPEAFPEVQEYMGWRLKRNKKRLMRLDAASRIIQGAYRAHLAWQIIKKLREERAAQYIQRCYRGWKGRLEFLEKMRLVWAAQLVQRNWRGHAGREQFLRRRIESGAITHIQRVWRGFVSRRLVRQLHEARWKGACSMQSCWRKRKARQQAFLMRIKRNASMLIQRLYRGHLGRRRCAVERDKFLFSRSQSQGIAFGRQMLLEHKLHATKLQSEVSVLTQEKVKCEEHIESLLDEISEFEEGVKTLEKEMHQLSKIQTESEGVLDEEAKVELRDQKIRLDSEFSQMLANIADRKENLTRLESNMVLLDRSRQAKEEELRVLERKLVVLLEEQQNELESIRRRQERKGEALIEGKTSVLTTATGGAGEGGGFKGPSAKDKRQAAQLMQSTETLMKFGFMSMSMTYFSSLNMVRAMRTVAATDTVMAAVHENSSNRSMITGGGGGGGGGGSSGGSGGGCCCGGGGRGRGGLFTIGCGDVVVITAVVTVRVVEDLISGLCLPFDRRFLLRSSGTSGTRPGLGLGLLWFPFCLWPLAWRLTRRAHAPWSRAGSV